LKIIAVVAPLMGLLGTVTGMINTFQAITLFGTGDPKLMAGGISQALVTTVLGLTVAIPTVLLHTVVNGRSKRIIHILEEQSTGIVCEFSEKRTATEKTAG
jgi:biopolymer transport protein ExbB